MNRLGSFVFYSKMRQYYFATKATEHALRSALNNELGIYHTKTGAGIGGLFKKIIPIGKSLIKQGFEAAKPELKKIANRGINAAGNYAMQQVQNLTDRANTKIGVKRRKDALS